MKDYIAGYFDETKRLLDAVPSGAIERLVTLLRETWQEDRRLVLMGNGGSASTASHLVNDFQKCIHLSSGKPFKALCLSDCVPLVLAWANDTEYANVFAPQIECWVEPKDLVIGVSGSGNSPNVVRAIETANARGAHTYGLTGCGGGRLAGVAHESLIVESDNMQHIEDLHLVVLHVAFSALRDQTSQD